MIRAACIGCMRTEFAEHSNVTCCKAQLCCLGLSLQHAFPFASDHILYVDLLTHIFHRFLASCTRYRSVRARWQRTATFESLDVRHA